MSRHLKYSVLATAVAASLAGLVSAPAFAQSADAETTSLERVSITIGRGQLRSVQGVNSADFEAATPGTSPLVTVSRLPGVNFQSADPLGAYEWSTRFTVRAFSQNQLGFTLDDVPLGDMSYGNSNGLHISRAISSENVGRAALSQGSGSLETASSSNLGGTLQFYSADPLKKFGLQAAQTIGSNSDRRTFLRVDSGSTQLGEFFLSYTNQNAEKWKGQGEQRSEQVNFKFVKQFGDSRLSAFVNTSKRQEIDYQDMSLEMIKRLGNQWDNTFPDFGAALKYANTVCGNVIKTVQTPYNATCDDAYYAGSGLRNDTLSGVTLDAKLAENLRLKTTVYSHSNEGRGLWYSPYTASPDGTPIALRTTEYAIDRSGVVATMEYEIGSHVIKAGLWHEGNNFDQARRFYATSPNNVPSPYLFPSNPFFTQWQYAFNTKTDQFSLADTFAVSKDLSVGFGFKSLRATIEGKLLVGADKPNDSITASNGFLPQIGANYQLSKTDELFAAASRNMRAFQGAATGATPFATTAAGFAAIKNTLKPETADTVEGGWRTQTSQYQGSLTAYVVNFKNRQLGTQSGAGIQGNPTILSNVGGVRSMGLEAALSLRLAKVFTWYNSLSLGNSTYSDNVVSDGVAVATSGKTVTDAPEQMFKSSLGYDNGTLFGNLGLDYMSKRYYTYLNDGSVPERTLFNLSGGMRTKAVGGLSEATVQFGISNLFDKKYISTIGSNGFQNSDTTGTAQTLLVGAPRQLFVTISGKL